MLIGTAIIEAGPNKFEEFDWGEDLVKAINSLLDKEKHITVESTGHELEDLIGRMGKHARRAIERYPFDEPNKKSAMLIFKFFQLMGTRNGLIILGAIILAGVGLLFGSLEVKMYAAGAVANPDTSMFVRIMETFVKLLEVTGK